MLTATFNDGSQLRFEVVHGDGFEPHEGDTVLFEFPDGALREGVVRLQAARSGHGDASLLRGIYDRGAKVVALET